MAHTAYCRKLAEAAAFFAEERELPKVLNGYQLAEYQLCRAFRGWNLPLGGDRAQVVLRSDRESLLPLSPRRES